jgi:hypothetical protein
MALVAGSSTAHGQTSQARAEELFNKAVELSEARKYNEACPLLAESQKLDPTPGTLFALADCEREAQQFISSVAHFKEYLTAYETMKPDVRKRHDQRANIARGHINDLGAKIPTLKLTFPGGPPDGTAITRNGVAVSSMDLDSAVQLDPGEQVIVTKVPGRQDAEQRITLAPGDKKVVELAPGASLTGDAPPPPIEPDKPQSNARRTAGFVLLGVGGAALALGGVMGGLAVGQKGVVEENCSGLDCNQTGYDAAQSGRTFGNVSTIGLIAGGAMAAAGAVLLITAPKSKPKSGLVTRFGAGAGFGGAFLSVEGEF